MRAVEVPIQQQKKVKQTVTVRYEMVPVHAIFTHSRTGRMHNVFVSEEDDVIFIHVEAVCTWMATSTTATLATTY